MSKEGYVKFYRQMSDWEWYTDSATFHLFFHCVIQANHKSCKHRGVQLERGQFKTGRKKLSVETGLTERQIRTCLKRLQATNELTIKSYTQYSIITVNNYDKYQTKNEETTNELTIKRPSNDQASTTNKNDKNEKNDKNIVCVNKIFTPPTQKEIEDYLKIIGKKISSESISDFIRYWGDDNWCDKSGLKVNWKQKIISWANRDAKYQSTQQYKTAEEREIEKQERIRKRLEEWAKQEN